ncbi:MAG TPA: phosphoethanolamine transferase domain-containing protein, partial [Xanthomonadales bacterium]|nr:phosphoethanolamine transferase domain-containing protein [Xanthomonadales bacterium]
MPKPLERKRHPSLDWSSNRVLLAAALFLAVFSNLAFFRNLAATFAVTSSGAFHIASLALFLLCALVLFLSLISFRPIFKPALVLLLLLSSVTAYFMDTYNVIIDRDMIVNVMETDSAETLGLLTPRLLLYVSLLGLLPSALLWFIRIRQESIRRAFQTRLLLASGALLVMLALVLISSAFYTTFVREHKLLRYYVNPLTPLYAVFNYSSKRSGSSEASLQVIGEDVKLPASDIDRELVIMVVGETARADRFSLNGYARDTNRQLAKQGVISFTHVSACGTSTAISVPCMFSIYGQDGYSDNKAAATENVLDVLERTNAHILWRDNNSNSKGVADRVDYEDFRTPENNPVCDEECRDIGMLSGLQQYIDRQKNGDILIVLHQMGSHGPAYFMRYPAEFRVFKPTCETNQLDNCSNSEIGNAY